MRSLILVLSVLLLALPRPANAQDLTQHHRLVQPDLTAYLEAIPAILARDTSAPPDLPYAVITEVRTRYADQLASQSYADLRAAMHALYGDSPIYQILPDRDLWERALLIAMLREQNIDLASTAQLQVDDYDLVVTPVDFNSDSSDEYLIDVIRGCSESVACRSHPAVRGSAAFADYLVLERLANGHVRLIPTPLPWLSIDYRFDSEHAGRLFPLSLRDLIGDQNPEWVVLEQFFYGWADNSVRLHILGWRDGSLSSLTPETMQYENFSNCGSLDCLNVWQIEAAPGQAATIAERVPVEDNWHCVSEAISIYRWDGSAFSTDQAREIRFPHTFACLVRAAEQAMIDGRVEAAIPLYEAALALDAQA
ncbi:MAG: hypothetical protein KC519_23325, partial [Anaerolineae bacterium]|nr:hypothetical protein [Anaerolineae bacterium]